MKLKKFFKPLVTVSALSFMLMGCADDSSNSGGSTTTPPTAKSVFTKFLTDFQAAPAKNAEKPVEFTTNTATKPSLTVAKGEEVQYLVSLDNVMAVYYATFGIKGTSTTLLTEVGSDITADLTQIKNYAKVPAATEGTTESTIPLTLNNGTNSMYTGGMFALMTEQEVKDLDTALGELDKEIKAATPTEGDVTTPDLAKIQAATVQKVVDLINGNMYKVAYNSPAQSIQDAFAAAKPLTLKNGMAFNEGTSATTFEIAAGGLSYEGANPEIADNKVVVFLDEFKNKLNGVTASSEDTVKGATNLSVNTALGLTTDTATSSANGKAITYTPATEVVAGAKVTYVAILDATTDIDSGTDNAPFKVLNGKIADGATKAQVVAALDLLKDKIYKIDYTVNTIQSLIDAFKASTEATTAVASATPLTMTTDYEATIKGEATWSTNTKVYCLDISTEDPRLTLSKLDGSGATAALSNYIKTAAAQASGGDGKIVFTLTNSQTVKDQTVYAYCSSAADRSGGDSFNTAITGGTTNYEKLNGFLEALKTELKVYSYAIPAE